MSGTLTTPWTRNHSEGLGGPPTQSSDETLEELVPTSPDRREVRTQSEGERRRDPEDHRTGGTGSSRYSGGCNSTHEENEN